MKLNNIVKWANFLIKKYAQNAPLENLLVMADDYKENGTIKTGLLLEFLAHYIPVYGSPSFRPGGGVRLTPSLIKTYYEEWLQQKDKTESKLLDDALESRSIWINISKADKVRMNSDFIMAFQDKLNLPTILLYNKLLPKAIKTLLESPSNATKNTIIATQDLPNEILKSLEEKDIIFLFQNPYWVKKKLDEFKNKVNKNHYLDDFLNICISFVAEKGISKQQLLFALERNPILWRIPELLSEFQNESSNIFYVILNAIHYYKAGFDKKEIIELLDNNIQYISGLDTFQTVVGTMPEDLLDRYIRYIPSQALLLNLDRLSYEFLKKHLPKIMADLGHETVIMNIGSSYGRYLANQIAGIEEEEPDNEFGIDF